MRKVVYLVLLSSKLFSQEIIKPVEKESEFLNKHSNQKEYIFKDINNVFEKFLGKWHFEDDSFSVYLQVFKHYDEANRRDGVLIDLRVIKGNDTVIKTLPHLIEGGIFEDKNNVNKITVFFSEVSNVWQCGNSSAVNITWKNNMLVWEIEDRELRYNRSARLFPNNITFIKD